MPTKTDDVFAALEGGQIDVTRALDLLSAPPTPNATADTPTALPQRVRLRRLERDERAPVTVTAPVTAPSDDVVRCSVPEPGVGVIALCDEAGRNMLGPRLAAGLEQAAAWARADESLRVLVVHGFGGWFCAGGTPEILESIRAGRSRFGDSQVFRLLLDLELPTIAAMQGHALGGGLTFGLYADIPLFAEESFYAANFMEHGFTPGVGATLVLPLKLGEVLATEMMFGARRYTGKELAARGVSAIVAPRDQVIERALELARELAKKPRLQLLLLKQRLGAKLRAELPAVLEAEEALHRRIFDQGKRE